MGHSQTTNILAVKNSIQNKMKNVAQAIHHNSIQAGFGRKWPQTSVFILRRSSYPQPPPPLSNAPSPPPPSYPSPPNPSSTSQNPRGPNPSSESSLRPPPEQPSPLHSWATTDSPRSQSPTSETSASSPTSTTASPLWQTSS